MTDPVEEALRAIEAKYYPNTTEGRRMMPFYPREDVRVMVDAAIAAEREACAKIAESCDVLGPDFTDDELTAEGYIARKKTIQIAAAIRARGTT